MLAYFGTGNTIVADFPLWLAVVVDSKFGTTGRMCWNIDEEKYLTLSYSDGSFPPTFSVIEQMGSHV